jgi:hypothetical protein
MGKECIKGTEALISVHRFKTHTFQTKRNRTNDRKIFLEEKFSSDFSETIMLSTKINVKDVKKHQGESRQMLKLQPTKKLH